MGQDTHRYHSVGLGIPHNSFVINQQLDSTAIEFNQLPIQIDSSTTDDNISVTHPEILKASSSKKLVIRGH